MLRAIVALFTFLFFVLSGYRLAGGKMLALLHPLPMFIVLVTFSVIGSLLAIFPISSIRQSFQPSEDPEKKALAIRVWRHAEILSYLAGILGCLLGFSISSNFMDQPANDIGAHFGASLMGLIFGIIQGIFFRFLRIRAN
jgi:flagellar motor component MotA